MVEILPVDEHAWKLECILTTLDFDDPYNGDWFHICAWLQMASSIENVKLITKKFDSSMVFCGFARQFENDRNVMLANLATEITRFNFIWGAFESLVEELEPKIDGCNFEKYGKVAAARYIIRKSKISSFTGYNESLEKYIKNLILLLRETTNHSHIDNDQKENISKRFRKALYYSRLQHHEKGIFSVYKIRNLFAHGSYLLPYEPYPDDLDNLHFNDTDLIKISSTIVLMTMQMMLCSYFMNDNIMLENLFLFDELYLEDIDSIPLIFLLNNVHIKGYSELLV